MNAAVGLRIVVLGVEIDVRCPVCGEDGAESTFYVVEPVDRLPEAVCRLLVCEICSAGEP